ncbi:hypothetical protein TWF569_011795 [Orbilia oligospora]|uniref:Mitochondrial copper homeostasis protein n=1 Tax=Orbilia oligospora TaxID=2813651 RepID=A0A7C8PNW9_ORBOL|nr:hypothetical protein TWF706_009773 [Orbilia oligospora]KAF3102755.1 hypothetical protein TWF102_004415 [Orbilia oligospora]KAF3110393.1 hypothetical protein TWF103_004674 [Orbilia oligospora]KAF3122717.1 hypothetical protein TWF594_002761 [Orbilia oligospora]KAF3127436.1 hypothetical protein TWF569_011795 [Orbilia oligospora]
MPEIQYRENPVDEDTKRQFDTKETSKFYDPCQDAANRSLKCLRRNMGDREMCTDYFQAYRDCKKKWVEERKTERWKKAMGSLGFKIGDDSPESSSSSSSATAASGGTTGGEK